MKRSCFLLSCCLGLSYCLGLSCWVGLNPLQAMEVLNPEEERILLEDIVSDAPQKTHKKNYASTDHLVLQIQDSDYNGVVDIWLKIMDNLNLHEMYTAAQSCCTAYIAFTKHPKLKIPRKTMLSLMTFQDSHWFALKMLEKGFPLYPFYLDYLETKLDGITGELDDFAHSPYFYFEAPPCTIRATNLTLGIDHNITHLLTRGQSRYANPVLRFFANPWFFAGTVACSTILIGTLWATLPDSYTQSARDACMDPAKFGQDWIFCLDSAGFDTLLYHPSCAPTSNYLTIIEELGENNQTYSCTESVGYWYSFIPSPQCSLNNPVWKFQNLVSYLSQTFRANQTRLSNFFLTQESDSFGHVDSSSNTAIFLDKKYFSSTGLDEVNLYYFNPQCIYNDTRETMNSVGIGWGSVLLIGRFLFWLYILVWN